MFTIDFLNQARIRKFKHSVPTSITVVKHDFYICYPQARHILCFDEDFSCCNHVPVNGNYFDLCYDIYNNCFYALDRGFSDKIFMLDQYLQETYSFPIAKEPQQEIIAICCNEHTIFVATSSEILSIDSMNEELQRVFIAHCDNIIAIDTNDDKLYVIRMLEQTYILEIYDCCGSLLHEISLCCDGCILSMSVDHDSIYVLIQVEQQDFQVLQLCIKDTECGCLSACECSVLIQKIADIENQIACILNAEGMKIQYAIKACSHIDDLLAMNQSVQMTVQQLTQLELALYTKLMFYLCGPNANDCEITRLTDACNEL